MSAPHVSVIFCHHTAENAPAVAAAIPESNDPTYYTALECAYDDLDPSNDARRAIGDIQVDAQQFMAGEQVQLEDIYEGGFYSRFLQAAIALGRTNLKVLFVDAGRTTNGAQALQKVTKSFDGASTQAAWNHAAGDPAAYILHVASDIADSFTYRENLVADQVASIAKANQHEPMSLVVGADHYGLMPLLRARGLRASAIAVDRPSNSCEMAVVNMLRTGKQFEARVLAAMGLAEWLTPDSTKSGETYVRLRNKTHAEIMRLAQRVYSGKSVTV